MTKSSFYEGRKYEAIIGLENQFLVFGLLFEWPLQTGFTVYVSLNMLILIAKASYESLCESKHMRRLA